MKQKFLIYMLSIGIFFSGIWQFNNFLSVNAEESTSVTSEISSDNIDAEKVINYPIIVIDNSTQNMKIKKGSTATLTFTVYSGNFSSEMYTISIYKDGTYITGTTGYSQWGDNTYKYNASMKWDTNGCEAGEYTVVAYEKYYSDNAWQDAPVEPVSCSVFIYDGSSSSSSDGTSDSSSSDSRSTSEDTDSETVITRRSGASSVDVVISKSNTNDSDKSDSIDSGNSSSDSTDSSTSSWYPDVTSNTGSWRYIAVKYVTDHGIMNGVGNGLFSPDTSLTREMFATIIYRMDGSPETTYTGKFPDVPNNTYYSLAVEWANQNGIINGHSNTGTFGTGEKITREDLVVIMYRYAAFKGMDLSKTDSLSAFKDKSEISTYALNAMKWAVGNYIIKGRSTTGLVDPKGNASRVEAAVIIKRFMELQ